MLSGLFWGIAKLRPHFWKCWVAAATRTAGKAKILNWTNLLESRCSNQNIRFLPRESSIFYKNFQLFAEIKKKLNWSICYDSNEFFKSSNHSAARMEHREFPSRNWKNCCRKMMLFLKALFLATTFSKIVKIPFSIAFSSKIFKNVSSFPNKFVFSSKRAKN